MSAMIIGEPDVQESAAPSGRRSLAGALQMFEDFLEDDLHLTHAVAHFRHLHIAPVRQLSPHLVVRIQFDRSVHLPGRVLGFGLWRTDPAFSWMLNQS